MEDLVESMSKAELKTKSAVIAPPAAAGVPEPTAAQLKAEAKREKAAADEGHTDDAIKLYLKEIQKTNLLTAAEERELDAKRFPKAIWPHAIG